MPVSSSEIDAEWPSKHRQSTWWTNSNEIRTFALSRMHTLCFSPFLRIQPPFRLLDLPGKVRNQIYREMLLSEKARPCQVGLDY